MRSSEVVEIEARQNIQWKKVQDAVQKTAMVGTIAVGETLLDASKIKALVERRLEEEGEQRNRCLAKYQGKDSLRKLRECPAFEGRRRGEERKGGEKKREDIDDVMLRTNIQERFRCRVHALIQVLRQKRRLKALNRVLKREGITTKTACASWVAYDNVTKSSLFPLGEERRGEERREVTAEEKRRERRGEDYGIGEVIELLKIKPRERFLSFPVAFDIFDGREERLESKNLMEKLLEERRHKTASGEVDAHHMHPILKTLQGQELPRHFSPIAYSAQEFYDFSPETAPSLEFGFSPVSSGPDLPSHETSKICTLVNSSQTGRPLLSSPQTLSSLESLPPLLPSLPLQSFPALELLPLDVPTNRRDNRWLNRPPSQRQKLIDNLISPIIDDLSKKSKTRYTQANIDVSTSRTLGDPTSPNLPLCPPIEQSLPITPISLLKPVIPQVEDLAWGSSASPSLCTLLNHKRAIDGDSGDIVYGSNVCDGLFEFFSPGFGIADRSRRAPEPFDPSFDMDKLPCNQGRLYEDIAPELLSKEYYP